MLAILDTMMGRLEGQHDTFVVHYSVLDGDRQGRPPNDPHFDKAHKSCLHKIAKSNNKVRINSVMSFMLCQSVLYVERSAQYVGERKID